jgi:membrane protein implicated in regulation of membrane protease activity
MSEIAALFASNPMLVWAGVGVVLLIVEILMPQGFFLSFAAAGFLLALAAFVGVLPTDWVWQAVLFSALGVGLIVPLRRFLRRFADRTPDINQY